jgi:pilus assembly protein CpaC
MNARRALPLAALLATAIAALPSTAPAQTGYGQPSYGRLAGAPIREAQLGPPSAGQTVSIDLSGASTPVRTLSLPRGKSAVIDLPTDARDVLVSDPKVADVVLSTPRRIYVLGVGSGQTDAAFMDASGRQILRLNIRVDQDVSSLGDTLNRLLPGSTIHVESVNDSIVLSGEVANVAAATRPCAWRGP